MAGRLVPVSLVKTGICWMLSTLPHGCQLPAAAVVRHLWPGFKAA